MKCEVSRRIRRKTIVALSIVGILEGIRVGGILKAKFAGNADFSTFLDGNYMRIMKWVKW
jgi:hypothetical protein